LCVVFRYAAVNWNNTTPFIANVSDGAAVRAALPPGMIELHPDREISTALVASMSKLFPARACLSDARCAEALVRALNNISSALLSRGGLTFPTDCFMGAKGQAGLGAELAADFATTTLNPVLLDSIGTWLLMYVTCLELPCFHHFFCCCAKCDRQCRPPEKHQGSRD
jgi:hypothetical protein